MTRRKKIGRAGRGGRMNEEEKQADGAEEALVLAWVKLSAVIKNNRITEGLMYNEAIVMLLVYNEYRRTGEALPLAEIIAQTRMLKSLANRTVSALEEKGLAKRVCDPRDKRAVSVMLVPERIDEFLRVHRRSLALARAVREEIGEEDARAFLRLAAVIGDGNILSKIKKEEYKQEQ